MYYVRRDNVGDICYDQYFARCNIDKLIENHIPFQLVDLRANDSQLLHAPLTITVNVTDICNLSCGFCFYPCKKLRRVIEHSTIDNICRYIKSNYIYELDVLGGEPLCDESIDSTLYLVNNALSTGCIQKIYISSNGFYAHNLKKFSFNDKIALSISIQFGILRTYDRPEIKETLSFLEQSETEYVISTVVDNTTIHSMKDIIQFIGNLKYCKSLLLHYPSIFKSNENFAQHVPSINQFWQLLSDMKTLITIPISYDMPYAYYMNNSRTASNQFEAIFCSCSGEYRKIEIMPDGVVVPCALLIGNDKYIIGNINEENFRYIPVLKKRMHSCKNISCKFNQACKVCHAYIEDWGEDSRCPNYLNV